MGNQYCSFCNLVVAPGDRNRVEFGEIVAHNRCVISNKKDIYVVIGEITRHLRFFGRHEVLGFLVARKLAGRLNSRKALIDNITICFFKIDAWREKLGPAGKHTFPQPNLIKQSKQILGKLLVHEF